MRGVLKIKRYAQRLTHRVVWEMEAPLNSLLPGGMRAVGIDGAVMHGSILAVTIPPGNPRDKVDLSGPGMEVEIPTRA